VAQLSDREIENHREQKT